MVGNPFVDDSIKKRQVPFRTGLFNFPQFGHSQFPKNCVLYAFQAPQPPNYPDDLVCDDVFEWTDRFQFGVHLIKNCIVILCILTVPRPVA